MNVIQLMGGLGNQMFQYSFGQAQKKNGIDVCYTKSWYENTRRPYPRFLRLPLFELDLPIGDFLKQKLIKEVGFSLYLLKEKNANFHGYWQYLPYHELNIPFLRKAFCVKGKYCSKNFLIAKQSILDVPSVSVHVRRGDYVGHRGLHELPLSYYMEALQFVKGEIFVFSDDIGWCRKNFKSEYFSRKIHFFHFEDYLDFELMKICNHNIISASTFSWWAALLNENKDKIVVAPTGWLTGSDNKNDLHYPKSWVLI